MAKFVSKKSQSYRHLIDEQTQKKVHAHLVNEGDTISEKDISNVKTDFIDETETGFIPVPKAEAKTKDQAKEEEKLAEKKITDNASPSIQTTWNILDEE